MRNDLNNLEMAKKYDYKILITEEAINKIPRIKYIIVFHNHPSLLDFSLTDVQFLLRYDNVKMMVVITNLGSISYLVKNKKYDLKKAIALFNESVDKNNEAKNLKDLQNAANYFLRNSYTVCIDYDNR